jgi:hypothetical protein
LEAIVELRRAADLPIVLPESIHVSLRIEKRDAGVRRPPAVVGQELQAN